MDAPPDLGARLGVLESLEALALDELSAPELGSALKRSARVRGRLDAFDARALAAFERLGGAKADGATDTKAWLNDKTRTSAADAKKRVRRAKTVAALPQLGEALADGAISAGHVDAIGAIVPDKLLPKAGALVDDAKSSTPEELRKSALDFVAKADGDDGASRSERLRAQQRAKFFGRDTGMAALFAEWAPEDQATVESAVDFVADDLWRKEHPNRNPQKWGATTVEFRRAEALLEIARRVLAAKPLVGAAATAERPQGEVTDEELTEAARASARASRPLFFVLIDYLTASNQLTLKPVCELADGTPISPDTARRLLCDAGIIPMVLGSRGEVLDQGRKIYLPTMAQRRAVFIRDRHCMFPGCKRPAKWSDVHHIVWWETGGRTDYANLLLLCGTHHHMVHEGGWRLTGNAYDFTIHRPNGDYFDRVTRGP